LGAGIFGSSSATLLAEVSLPTSAGGDETDEIAVSAANPFGFLAFSGTETPEATGADCCLHFEARELSPGLASAALLFFVIFFSKNFKN
jgi:hypothetical protein